jgi:5'-nucleotidase
MGRPGVALSVGAYAPPFDFACAADFALRNLATFVALADEDHFVNVNFPNTECARATPMITFPSRRIYRDELKTYTAPNHDLFCFIGGPLPDARLEEGSDCDAVGRGFISITPVHVHPAYHDPIEERYREATFR